MDTRLRLPLSRRPLAALVRLLHTPARVVAAAFLALVAVGTLLLSLPLATEHGQPAGLMTALFTATSAACVTGHSLVDTPTFWSAFGEAVIVALVQVGGFGVMSLATLLALLTARRLGLRARLWTQAEIHTLGPGDVTQVVRGIALVSVGVEASVALLLATRLALGYGEPLGRAVWLGTFHGVLAFNNVGFSLYSDNLTRFAADPWVCLPVAAAVITGGLGFPVLRELRRELRTPHAWSLHTKLTVGVTVVLLFGGTALITVLEWANPATLGRLPAPARLLAGFFHSAVVRTAGFNTVDLGELHPSTLLGMDLLMFVGGGSASTAGGIKVTTFALLAFVIWAELRGEQHVHVLGRRLPDSVQRQALTVALLGVAAVAAGAMLLLALTPYGLDAVLFEAVSAFATAGMTTGITPQLPTAGHAILAVLMFIGRVGPVTLGTALALRDRSLRYELPEERPIVG